MTTMAFCAKTSPLVQCSASHLSSQFAHKQNLQPLCQTTLSPLASTHCRAQLHSNHSTSRKPHSLRDTSFLQRRPLSPKLGLKESISQTERISLGLGKGLGARIACKASEEGRESGAGKGTEGGAPYGVLSMLALWGFWAGLVYYAFALAPNQTPIRDEYFLGKLTLLIQDDYPFNQVLTSEFNIMGIWPAIYTALLIPAGRSNNLRPPIWPFASLSVGIGIVGLLPYFALWQQPTPPPPSEKERNSLVFKVLESKITAGALLAGALGLIGAAVASGPDSWVGFYQYFQESKFVHVMTLDFFCLTLFCPFWLYNDMEFRNWSGRNTWIVPLSLLPVLGPAFYLLIRPPLPEPRSEGKQVAEAPKPIG